MFKSANVLSFFMFKYCKIHCFVIFIHKKVTFRHKIAKKVSFCLQGSKIYITLHSERNIQLLNAHLKIRCWQLSLFSYVFFSHSI